ncbi:MAG: redoxin domain-containing protein [Bacteroidota bacterium]
MKKLILFGALLCFCFSSSWAQQINIGIGEPAPKITVTDWLLNQPEDTNLEGKFIVLEFWATWCGPCLKAIPHLNELNASVEDRDDVQFISMTYEKADYVNKFIHRLGFETAVATDVSSVTKRSFGIKGVPKTVLIDNKGIVQWMGHPMHLSEEKFKLFLDGKKIVEKEQERQITSIGEISKKLIEHSRNNENYFEITEVTDPKRSRGYRSKNSMYRYGYTMDQIMTDLLDISLAELQLPEFFKGKRYELGYIHKNKLLSEAELKRKILNSILKNFNWKFSKVQQEVNIYEIRVADRSLLNVSKIRNKRGGTSTYKEVIFRNQSMEGISNLMSNKMGEFIVNKTLLDETYDMVLSFESIEALEKDLKANGLKLIPKTKKHKIFVVSQNNAVNL